MLTLSIEEIVLTESIIVEKNFSRNPDYYHQHAETQQHVANKLAEMIQQNPTGNVQKILEIGCGTGFLTEKLFSIFPNADFTITDISKSMLKFCEQQTQKSRSSQKIIANFAVNDISKSCPEGPFDLIVSSLAFQWVNDLSAVLQKLHKNLSHNGILIFSTLSKDTFSSVKKIFDDFKIIFPEPKLLDIQKIQSACKTFPNVNITNELSMEQFDSMLMFLRHIQGTGAGNASGTPLSTKDLKKIIPQCRKKISAEYVVSYVVCKTFVVQ